MNRQRILLLLCFVLLFSYSPGTVSAAEISQDQLATYEQIFQQLDSNNQKLSTILTQSQTDLTQAQSELTQLKLDLELCKVELAQAKKSATTTQDLLNREEISLNKLSKEIKLLKLERDVGIGIAILACLLK